MEFNKLTKSKLEDRGSTYTWFASKMGVSKNTVTSWMKLRVEIPKTKRALIRQVLGI